MLVAGGVAVSPGAVIASSSPQRPDDLVVEVAAASPEQVADMALRARAASRDWSRAPAAVRAGALRAAGEALATNAEEAARLVAREVGKPIGEARGEVGRGVAILHYYAQQVFDPTGELHAPSDRKSTRLNSSHVEISYAV